MGKYARRTPDPEKNGSPAPETCWGEWVERYPALVEYMTLDKWEDGKPRATASLLLFMDQGRVKARFSDRALSRTLWLSAESLRVLLECLEADLEEGTGDWRQEKQWHGKNSRG